jgi:hypothetical protein
MMRRVSYRTAFNAFVFTGLWLVLGGLVALSPAPRALGIDYGFFAAYVILFFVLLALSGVVLTLAAINTAFPAQRSRPPARPKATRETSAAPPPWPSQPTHAPTPARRGSTRQG